MNISFFPDYISVLVELRLKVNIFIKIIPA